MNKSKKRKRSRDNDEALNCFERVPKGVMGMIFDRVGLDDDTIVKSRRVCSRWKQVLDKKCMDKNCPKRDILSNALLFGHKSAISHLLKHEGISKRTRIELLSASNSSKLLENVDFKQLGDVSCVLLMRACIDGKGDAVRVLLNKGVTVTTKVLLSACMSLQDRENEKPLKTILSYTGPETRQITESRLLEGLLDSVPICDISPIDFNNKSNKNLLFHRTDGHLTEARDIDSDSHEIKGEKEWQSVAHVIDDILKSQALSRAMRRLTLTRAFTYLFRWESRFCTTYNYVQAFSTAIETKDVDFCNRLYEQNPGVLRLLPVHFLDHFARLNWSNILENFLELHPGRSMDIAILVIQYNSVDAFSVAFSIALKYLELVEPENYIKEFLNVVTLSIIHHSNDKLLTILLDGEHVLKYMKEAEHAFLLEQSLVRGLYDSVNLLFDLAAKKEESYRIQLLIDSAERIVRNLMMKGKYNVISKFLSIPYVKIPLLNVFEITAVLRLGDYLENTSMGLKDLKSAMEKRTDLFECV